MSDNPYRAPPSWMTRRRRMRVQQEGAKTPQPWPTVKVPVTVVHYGFPNGTKGQREFTYCGEKSAGLAMFDREEHVNCVHCLNILKAERASVAHGRRCPCGYVFTIPPFYVSITVGYRDRDLVSEHFNCDTVSVAIGALKEAIENLKAQRFTF